MKYLPFPDFVLRTPLLPFSNLKSNTFSDLSNPLIRESIFLASPVLFIELNKKETVSAKDRERIEYALERYFSRMTTRCTPFGLFAGCTEGKTKGEKTSFTISDTISRRTRLDMYFLYSLYDFLIKIPEIKTKIKYYPNNSLYSIGKKYRYVEYQSTESGRNYKITEIERTLYLDKILRLASKGSNIQSIISGLSIDNIPEEDIRLFIDELIDSQILLGELCQSVVGDDFLNRVIFLLETINCNDSLLVFLKEIKYLLEKIDTGNNGLGLYEKIIAIIEKTKVPFKETYLFQTDMFKDAIEVSIGNNILNELQKVMTFLNKITPIRNNELLNQFQKRFDERYETREVPLLEALDPELGIGYPPGYGSNDISPLVDNMFLPLKMGQGEEPINFFQSLMLKKIAECTAKNQTEITLTDNDIKNFTPNWDDLPPTIYTLFEIIRSQPDNTLIKLNYFGGNCGANLIGRFAYADENLNQLVKSITQKEKELLPDMILAEIVYLPESRIGNILYRPHFRDYEIPYMAYSDLPSKQLLYLSDLMLSIKKGKMVIRSKKLNKEILPRLTTAHNYLLSSMPVYRFLCDMQHSTGRNSIYFSWGNLLQKEFTFLPRVRYSNTILSPATWNINIKEIEPYFKIKKDEELLIETTKFRKENRIPRYTLMKDGDNELFVDWENVISIRSLFTIIQKRQNVIFTEFLFEPENAVTKNNSGVYRNECLVALYKNKNNETSSKNIHTR